MRYDVVLPNESVDMDGSTLVELAVEAERLGYATAWLPDHLLPPVPYDRTYGGVYEPLITLAHLAAATTTLRLGTSVVIVPLREPILLAKQVATLARLSGDRFSLGVGSGWERSEFDAVGADFRTRGRRLDETIDRMRRFHDGEGTFAPLPHRPVPIVVGGTSDAALARAARVGDEWQGVGLDPDAFAVRLADLRRLTDRPVVAGTRLPVTTDAEVDDAVATARDLEGRGAGAIGVWFGEVDGFADRMARFRSRVRPPSRRP